MTLPSGLSQKAAFAPVANAETRVLVLGSLPGEISLKRRQYYANPTNQFWRMMAPIIETDLPAMDYESRLAALLQGGVGLWDVIGSAKRNGSLDSAIRDYTANPLEVALARLPSLQALAFNGAKAFKIGQRQLAGTIRATLISLPSSSAAYCAMSFETKLGRWRQLQTLLAPNAT